MSIEHSAACVVCGPSRELDASHVGRFRAAFELLKIELRMVVDRAAATFIDSPRWERSSD